MIDSSVFGSSKIRRVAQLMRWTEDKALSRLFHLWHASQEMELVEVTHEDVAWFSRLDEAEAIQFADALVQSGWIKRLESGKFRVHGNERQIKINRAYKEKSDKMAEARLKKKRRENSHQESLQESLEEEHQVAPIHSNTIHSNTIQNTKEKKQRVSTRPKKSVSVVPEKPPPNGQRFIAAYVDACKTHRNFRPEIDGKAAGTAKRIVGSLGADRACELVQVYVQMDDRWFDTKAWDLTTFESNLNKISRAYQHGRDPTGTLDWEKFWEAYDDTG